MPAAEFKDALDQIAAKRDELESFAKSKQNRHEPILHLAMAGPLPQTGRGFTRITK